jgi:hypothetical protein
MVHLPFGWKQFKAALLVALCLISLQVPSVAEAAPKTSSGKTCTIVGTAGNDVLKGTSKSDVICGLGGDDVIDGASGNDTIDGGDGKDFIKGGDGADTISGGKGDDGIIGGSGADIISGSQGAPDPGEKNLCQRDSLDKVTYCGFDESGPVITSMTASRDIVNTTADPQTITITMHVTDDLMGVRAMHCRLFNVKDRSWASEKGDGLVTKISGTINDGIWTCNLTLKRGSLTGDYQVDVERSDNAGNNSRSGSDAVTIIQQIGSASGDQERPRITIVKLDKTSIDVSTKASTIKVSVSATDDYSGLAGVWCGLQHKAYYGSDWIPATITSGSSLDGTWVCPITIPRGVGQGSWDILVHAFDKANKETDQLFRNSFTQTGAGDDILPKIKSISLDKPKVNASSSDQTYTATVVLFDKTGIQTFALSTMSPTTGAINDGQCEKSSIDAEGNETWKCVETLRLGSQKGLHLFWGELYDKTNNRVQFSGRVTGAWQFWPYNDPTLTTSSEIGPVGIVNSDN